jgi:hypothetical protein
MKSKTYFWSVVFAISMGFFESAVVIYLRKIAYPGGFAFPLQPLSTDLATTEIFREVFSLIMLYSVSALLGKRSMEKFGWFIFNFAIWDIFFYIFLFILSGWPHSLFTMDLLFLIPVVWTGPVLAPIILSGLMIFLGILIINYSQRIRYLRFRAKEFMFLGIGSLLCLVSFMLDYILFSNGNTTDKQFVPDRFNWIIFGIGAFLILIGILLFLFNNKKSKHSLFDTITRKHKGHK